MNSIFHLFTISGQIFEAIKISVATRKNNIRNKIMKEEYI